MNSPPQPTRKRSRGLVLTEEALKLLDLELKKWWEKSAARQASKTGKLSLAAKAEGLGLDAKTVRRIYDCEPIDEISLRTAFDRLNIVPQFSKERHCAAASLSSGNLPHVSTHCIGRETQVTEIKKLLKHTPLITLIGAGGIGKTRLAIQAAEEMKGHYVAGIWFVELAGVADQALVPQTVATTLGIKEETQRPLMHTLADFLRGKQLLLILDNCEHLLQACATLAHHLLSTSSNLRMLATSRERLNIPSECPYRVPSLATPDMKGVSGANKDIAKSLLACDSVRLFAERARGHRPDFTVTNQNAPLLASICHRLDGIPLALELAAARVRAMTLDELERELKDCFRILTGGNRAALPRHQTLQATMDWSYNLLEEKEKTLLRRLSVFADGCVRQAAEYVCTGEEIPEWEVLDLLTSLVDKSLVVYQERAGKARYLLLETIRQYGRQRLAASGESDRVLGRHRDYFLALALVEEPKRTGVEKVGWLERLEAEHANLRAALRWSLSEVVAAEALRLCAALSEFWVARGYLLEGLEWCAQALRLANGLERTAQRAKVLYGAGLLAYFQGNYAAARPWLEESVAIFRETSDRRGIAASLNVLGMVVCNQGDIMAARPCYEESLNIFQEIGNLNGMATSINGLGSVAASQGDYRDARCYYDEGLTIRRKVGNRSGIANSLNNVAGTARLQGDYEFARSCYEECLAIWKEIGNRTSIPYTMIGLGMVDHAQGDYSSARRYVEESLTLCRETGDRGGIAYGLTNLGLILVSEEDYGVARSLFEESLTTFREIGNRDCMAISLNGLGLAACSQGDFGAARAFFEASLTHYREIGNRCGVVSSLEAFADLTARESNAEHAAVLWGAAAALREEIGIPLAPGDQKKHDHDVTEARQKLSEEAFSAAWAHGCSMTLEQAAEYALTKTTT